MTAQIGYFDTLKSIVGKVFTYLASITLTGTDGKTITVTQDTSLDEAVAMSSKAPKADPSFTGMITKSALVKEWAVRATPGDTTADIVLTYTPAAASYSGHILEILAAISDTASGTNYSCILRYAITSIDAANPCVVVDLTHDIIGGTVSESVSVSNNVVTVTITMPGGVVMDEITVYVKDVCSRSTRVLLSVTVT